MIRFERDIILGLLRKGVILVVPAMGIAYFFGGWRGSLGVLAGELLMLTNIMGLAWVLGRGLRDDPAHRRRPLGLAALFLLKLLVLFGIAYYVLAVVGLSPIGFVSGCMMALGVLSWQVVATPSPPQDESSSE
jgi:hypothetical protein